MDLKKGQKVYVLKIGNASRYYEQNKIPIEERISEEIVSKVGNKYFYLDGEIWSRQRFFIKDGYNDGRGYVSDYRAYQTKEEILLSFEIRKLKNEIQAELRYSFPDHLNYEEIKTIHSIIKK